MMDSPLRAAAAAPTPVQNESLYEPLDWILVRTPLLPVRSYLELADEERQLSGMSDPIVRRALAAGSPSLLGAIERFRQSGLTRRDAERMRAKLLRYQIRMATRPTPYGLFAGVALGRWGPATDLRVLSTCAFTRTRPDMAWLMGLALSAEARPAVRRQLEVFANPLAVVQAGRVCLSERAPTGAGGQDSVSIRATGVVRRALELARSPIPYHELAARLCEMTPSATPEKVDKLLDELWQQTLLLTELRPPLTTVNPAQWIAEHLRPISEAAEEWTRLDSFLTTAAEWDRSTPEESIERFRTLLARVDAPQDGSQQTPVQVDMAISVAGRIGSAVAAEAARAAEILLRLSPWPRGLSSLEGYRQAFVNRYGLEREVALLKLLDPQRGLGPPSLHGHAATGPAPQKAEERSRTLLRLACTALHDRQRVVILDEPCLARLETGRPDSAAAPLSLDLNVLVAARSAAAIDAGDFKLVVGPNLGATAAGRNLARFAELLAPEAPNALERCAAAEQAHTRDRLWAEIVYLPANLRSANVVIRPPIRSYELPVGVSAGVPASGVIPLDQLVVGIEESRFYVRWPAAGKRILFSSGHMLNSHGAPALVRFLLDASVDGQTVFTSFDWGPAEGFPYLPRVEVGRSVLRPAEWRLQKDDLAGGLDLWRNTWDVPRHVCLSFGDNRLVLDLDQAAQAAELEVEVKKLGQSGGTLVVQEVLPALEDAWLLGPGGHYYSELVVPMALRRDPSDPTRPTPSVEPENGATRPAVAPPAADAIEKTDSPAARYHPPGSDWLYVKLYCPKDHENDVICASMKTFAENAVASQLVDSWFFIRYSDPEPHLRARFHGSPERLRGQLFAHLCDWAGGLMSDGLCLKFMLDTYEQEIERFGGPEGMAASEALFAADSRGAAELVGICRDKRWPKDLTTLLALSIDDLLGSLGFGEADRLRWYREQTTDGGPEAGADYRQRKNVLRALLAQPAESLAKDPGGVEIAVALARRRSALLPVGQRLRQLAEQGALSQSIETLCSSFVHLHVNRVAGAGGPEEQRTLALLLRTRESLEKAPVSA
ncbi:MAG TPA: lantibiotic dehydratase [Thermoanaerobaculia bacterium]|nr:lantibiotic dehydratase [Thermoanaerobaculia bacterium]